MCGHVARRFLYCQRGSEDAWQKQQTLFQIACFIQYTSVQYTHCVAHWFSTWVVLSQTAHCRFVHFQSGIANIRRPITEIWQQLSPAIKFISLVFHFIIVPWIKRTYFHGFYSTLYLYIVVLNAKYCYLPGNSGAGEFKQQRWCDYMLDRVPPKLTSVEHSLQTLSPLQCQASVMLNSPHHILHSVGSNHSLVFNCVVAPASFFSVTAHEATEQPQVQTRLAWLPSRVFIFPPPAGDVCGEEALWVDPQKILRKICWCFSRRSTARKNHTVTVYSFSFKKCAGRCICMHHRWHAGVRYIHR